MKGEEVRTFKFDVAVDNHLVVEVGDRADEFGKDAADERGSEDFPVGGRDVKEVAAGVVAEHEDGAGRLDAPGLEVDQGGVANVLHDFELALEGHLDAILGCAAAGAMLADLDGYERPAFMLRGQFRGGKAGSWTYIFVVG